MREKLLIAATFIGLMLMIGHMNSEGIEECLKHGNSQTTCQHSINR